MDQFVQEHLKQIGCEHWIPMFEENGFNNEDSYKQLTLGKLIQLLPNDEDIVLKIINDVRKLKNPASSTSLFPSPNVVVKTEVLEEMPANSHDVDDEVQIINITIRAPSGFTRVEIKQERQEAPEVVEASQNEIPGAPDHSTHEMQNTGSGGSSDRMGQAELNVSTTGPGGKEREPNDAVVVTALNGRGDSLDSSYNIINIISDAPSGERSNLRRSPRIRKTKDDVEVQPLAKISRIDISSISEWKRVHCILVLTSSAPNEKIEFKKRFNESLAFIFSSNEELDSTLMLLEEFSGYLSNVVKSLELNDSNTKNTTKISNLQIERLANLPQLFWSELETLTFNLSFSESTDFKLITRILSKCSNLNEFSVRGGVLLSGDVVKSLQIPRMDKLVSFKFPTFELLFAKDYGVDYTPAVDVETDEYINAHLSLKFQIDFDDRVFPRLEILKVGTLIDLNFNCLRQFPKLRSLNMGHSREKNLLRLEKDSVYKNLECLNLQSALSSTLIQRFPHWFPNLSGLCLCLPSTDTICSMIGVMGSMNMNINDLRMILNFEFESALITALCGRPYELVTETDKTKLAKLKEYKHWKSFVEELRIEIPREELCTSVVEPDDENSGLPRSATIGSFKHLRKLDIQHLSRTVYLPQGDLHWRNPAVKLSANEWTSFVQPFPSCILLDELTKLKGILTHVNLGCYEVDTEVADKFKDIMGYKIAFEREEVDDTLDVLEDVDLKTNESKRNVKQERE